MADWHFVLLDPMTLPSVNFAFTVDFSPRLGGVNYALTVEDVLLDVFMVWSLEGPCVVAEHYRRRAINDLNRAIQMIWNQSGENNYWTNSTLKINFEAGRGEHPLPNNIQNVSGDVRIHESRDPLIALSHRSEVDHFKDLYLDSRESDTPMAYYIDRQSQAGNDPVQASLLICPTPKENTVICLEVTNEAPRFTWEDYTKRTEIPIPHKYIESLLLPVVRYMAANFWLYSGGEEKRQAMAADYADVARQIGLADPIPVKDSADSKEVA